MSKRMIENDCLVVMGENGEKLLSIRESFDEDRVCLMPEGNINMNVAHDFEDELVAAASVCDKITVDFSEVGAISSAGIKALLQVQRILDKRQNAFMVIKAISDEVYEMFDSMGFVDLFEIEK